MKTFSAVEFHHRMQLVEMEQTASNRVNVMPQQDFDMISFVRNLHGLSSQEFSKLMKDNENCSIQFHTRKGLLVKADVEKLANVLPQHLIAVLLSSDRDESLFKYMLSGVRLLHSLCDVAHRHLKLEQVLLDDVKISEQLLDLVFYILIVLGNCGQDEFKSLPVFHSALTASTLHLLTAFVSSQWQDLVQVLLAHPKVDIFMDAAFGSVLVDINFLQLKLAALEEIFASSFMSVNAKIVIYICQQCEASLQFILSLSQQKVFRERLLRNKELCGNGGVLYLVQAILKLNTSAHLYKFPSIVSSVSRIKAKILAVLLHMCEAENISYLDEVASSPRCFNLAKSVALEVLEVLKSAVVSSLKSGISGTEQMMPMGLLQLNALRLADIFSDDSNFRSYITTYFTKLLTAIFSLPHGEFLSIWCSSDLPLREEDASLEYDAFASTGWFLDIYSGVNRSDAVGVEHNLVTTSMPQATYAHQRTSLFVKVIANLHCFVPNICAEQERNLFLHKFIECMQSDPSESLPGSNVTSGSMMAATVCRNLRSLLRHAESLIPNFSNEEDVQLLRVFFNQLRALLNPSGFAEIMTQDENLESLENFSQPYQDEQHQEVQGMGRYPSPITRDQLDCSNRYSNHREELADNTVFHGEASLNCLNTLIEQNEDDADRKDKSCGNASDDIDRLFQNADISGAASSSSKIDYKVSSADMKESGFKAGKEDEKSDNLHFEDKLPRKRKRTIMNEHQMMLVERALLVEPDMQRHATSLQSLARELSHHGPEVTSLQLKNWLNNRKARLARAGKDSQSASDAADKDLLFSTRCSEESPESHGDDSLPLNDVALSLDCTQSKPGQPVALLDAQGEEIGKGKLHQVQGTWYGRSLDEMGTFVVDVSELKVESFAGLPYPSEVTGASFSEAKAKIGAMRVLWSPDKLVVSSDRDLNR